MALTKDLCHWIFQYLAIVTTPWKEPNLPRLSRANTINPPHGASYMHSLCARFISVVLLKVGEFIFISGTTLEWNS
jgi:hypothetical protein